MDKTREQHLKWCKDRAMEYVNMGDNSQALASMASDLGKHPDTAPSSGMASTLGIGLLMAGQLGTVEQGAKFIQGFN
jgi:hypothetical protein